MTVRDIFKLEERTSALNYPEKSEWSLRNRNTISTKAVCLISNLLRRATLVGMYFIYVGRKERMGCGRLEFLRFALILLVHTFF